MADNPNKNAPPDATPEQNDPLDTLNKLLELIDNLPASMNSTFQNLGSSLKQIQSKFQTTTFDATPMDEINDSIRGVDSAIKTALQSRSKSVSTKFIQHQFQEANFEVGNYQPQNNRHELRNTLGSYVGNLYQGLTNYAQTVTPHRLPDTQRTSFINDKVNQASLEGITPKKSTYGDIVYDTKNETMYRFMAKNANNPNQYTARILGKDPGDPNSIVTKSFDTDDVVPISTVAEQKRALSKSQKRKSWEELDAQDYAKDTSPNRTIHKLPPIDIPPAPPIMAPSPQQRYVEPVAPISNFSQFETTKGFATGAYLARSSNPERALQNAYNKYEQYRPELQFMQNAIDPNNPQHLSENQIINLQSTVTSTKDSLLGRGKTETSFISSELTHTGIKNLVRESNDPYLKEHEGELLAGNEQRSTQAYSKIAGLSKSSLGALASNITATSGDASESQRFAKILSDAISTVQSSQQRNAKDSIERSAIQNTGRNASMLEHSALSGLADTDTLAQLRKAGAHKTADVAESYYEAANRADTHSKIAEREHLGVKKSKEQLERLEPVYLKAGSEVDQLEKQVQNLQTTQSSYAVDSPEYKQIGRQITTTQSKLSGAVAKRDVIGDQYLGQVKDVQEKEERLREAHGISDVSSKHLENLVKVAPKIIEASGELATVKTVAPKQGANLEDAKKLREVVSTIETGGPPKPTRLAFGGASTGAGYEVAEFVKGFKGAAQIFADEESPREGKKKLSAAKGLYRGSEGAFEAVETVAELPGGGQQVRSFMQSLAKVFDTVQQQGQVVDTYLTTITGKAGLSAAIKSTKGMPKEDKQNAHETINRVSDQASDQFDVLSSKVRSGIGSYRKEYEARSRYGLATGFSAPREDVHSFLDNMEGHIGAAQTIVAGDKNKRELGRRLQDEKIALGGTLLSGMYDNLGKIPKGDLRDQVTNYHKSSLKETELRSTLDKMTAEGKSGTEEFATTSAEYRNVVSTNNNFRSNISPYKKVLSSLGMEQGYEAWQSISKDQETLAKGSIPEPPTKVFAPIYPFSQHPRAGLAQGLAGAAEIYLNEGGGQAGLQKLGQEKGKYVQNTKQFEIVENMVQSGTPETHMRKFLGALNSTFRMLGEQGSALDDFLGTASAKSGIRRQIQSGKLNVTDAESREIISSLSSRETGSFAEVASSAERSLGRYASSYADEEQVGGRGYGWGMRGGFIGGINPNRGGATGGAAQTPQSLSQNLLQGLGNMVGLGAPSSSTFGGFLRSAQTHIGTANTIIGADTTRDDAVSKIRDVRTGLTGKILSGLDETTIKDTQLQKKVSDYQRLHPRETELKEQLTAWDAKKETNTPEYKAARAEYETITDQTEKLRSSGLDNLSGKALKDIRKSGFSEIRNLVETLKTDEQVSQTPSEMSLGQKFKHGVMRPVSNTASEFLQENAGMARMAMMFHMTTPMFQALGTVPQQAAYESVEPILSAAGNLTGVSQFKSAVLGYPQQIPQISSMLQSQTNTLQSVLGSRSASQATVQTSLDIARTQPVQFPEAMEIMTSMAVNPSTKNAVMNPKFQEDTFNAVQLLSAIKPEQGMGGALFAIRELMSGVTRSMQYRFNMSPEVISNYAGMSYGKFRALPGEQMIGAMSKGLMNMFGGDEVLLRKGAQYDVQLNNIQDSMTNAIVKPLVTGFDAQAIGVVRSAAQTPSREGGSTKVEDSLLRAMIPESSYRQMMETSMRRSASQFGIEYQRGTSVEEYAGKLGSRGEQFKTSVQENFKNVGSELYGTPMGMVSLIATALGKAVDPILGAAGANKGIGGTISDFGSVFKGRFATFTKEMEGTDALSGDAKSSKQGDVAQNFIKALVTDLNNSLQNVTGIFTRGPGSKFIKTAASAVSDMAMTSFQPLAESMAGGFLNAAVKLPTRIIGPSIMHGLESLAPSKMFGGEKGIEGAADTLEQASGIGAWIGFQRMGRHGSVLQNTALIAGSSIAGHGFHELSRSLREPDGDVLSPLGQIAGGVAMGIAPAVAGKVSPWLKSHFVGEKISAAAYKTPGLITEGLGALGVTAGTLGGIGTGIGAAGVGLGAYGMWRGYETWHQKGATGYDKLAGGMEGAGGLLAAGGGTALGLAGLAALGIGGAVTAPFTGGASLLAAGALIGGSAMIYGGTSMEESSQKRKEDAKKNANDIVPLSEMYIDAPLKHAEQKSRETLELNWKDLKLNEKFSEADKSTALKHFTDYGAVIPEASSSIYNKLVLPETKDKAAADAVVGDLSSYTNQRMQAMGSNPNDYYKLDAEGKIQYDDKGQAILKDSVKTQQETELKGILKGNVKGDTNVERLIQQIISKMGQGGAEYNKARDVVSEDFAKYAGPALSKRAEEQSVYAAQQSLVELPKGQTWDSTQNTHTILGEVLKSEFSQLIPETLQSQHAMTSTSLAGFIDVEEEQEQMGVRGRFYQGEAAIHPDSFLKLMKNPGMQQEVYKSLAFSGDPEAYDELRSDLKRGQKNAAYQENRAFASIQATEIVLGQRKNFSEDFFANFYKDEVKEGGKQPEMFKPGEEKGYVPYKPQADSEEAKEAEAKHEKVKERVSGEIEDAKKADKTTKSEADEKKQDSTSAKSSTASVPEGKGSTDLNSAFDALKNATNGLGEAFIKLKEKIDTLIAAIVSPNKADTTKADTTKADTTKADTAKADTTKADTAKADTTKADTTKADTTKADTTKADTTKADTAKAQEPDTEIHNEFQKKKEKIQENLEKDLQNADLSKEQRAKIIDDADKQTKEVTRQELFQELSNAKTNEQREAIVEKMYAQGLPEDSKGFPGYAKLIKEPRREAAQKAVDKTTAEANARSIAPLSEIRQENLDEFLDSVKDEKDFGKTDAAFEKYIKRDRHLALLESEGLSPPETKKQRVQRLASEKTAKETRESQKKEQLDTLSKEYAPLIGKADLSKTAELEEEYQKKRRTIERNFEDPDYIPPTKTVLGAHIPGTSPASIEGKDPAPIESTAHIPGTSPASIEGKDPAPLSEDDVKRKRLTQDMDKMTSGIERTKTTAAGKARQARREARWDKDLPEDRESQIEYYKDKQQSSSDLIEYMQKSGDSERKPADFTRAKSEHARVSKELEKFGKDDTYKKELYKDDTGERFTPRYRPNMRYMEGADGYIELPDVAALDRKAQMDSLESQKTRSSEQMKEMKEKGLTGTDDYRKAESSNQRASIELEKYKKDPNRRLINASYKETYTQDTLDQVKEATEKEFAWQQEGVGRKIQAMENRGDTDSFEYKAAKQQYNELGAAAKDVHENGVKPPPRGEALRAKSLTEVRFDRFNQAKANEEKYNEQLKTLEGQGVKSDDPRYIATKSRADSASKEAERIKTFELNEYVPAPLDEKGRRPNRVATGELPRHETKPDYTGGATSTRRKKTLDEITESVGGNRELAEKILKVNPEGLNQDVIPEKGATKRTHLTSGIPTFNDAVKGLTFSKDGWTPESRVSHEKGIAPSWWTPEAKTDHEKGELTVRQNNRMLEKGEGAWGVVKAAVEKQSDEYNKEHGYTRVKTISPDEWDKATGHSDADIAKVNEGMPARMEEQKAQEVQISSDDQMKTKLMGGVDLGNISTDLSPIDRMKNEFTRAIQQMLNVDVSMPDLGLGKTPGQEGGVKGNIFEGMNVDQALNDINPLKSLQVPDVGPLEVSMNAGSPSKRGVEGGADPSLPNMGGMDAGITLNVTSAILNGATSVNITGG